MDYAFPFHPDSLGRTAVVDSDRHIHDLIEQVLFTAPGERVNRPDFGTGLMQLVFAPNSVELDSATQLLVQGALQQWLGGLIQVNTVEVATEDSSLRITVNYLNRRSQEQRQVQFEQGAGL